MFQMKGLGGLGGRREGGVEKFGIKPLDRSA